MLLLHERKDFCEITITEKSLDSKNASNILEGLTTFCPNNMLRVDTQV